LLEEVEKNGLHGAIKVKNIKFPGRPILLIAKELFRQQSILEHYAYTVAHVYID
jgi:hypothetical protein